MAVSDMKQTQNSIEAATWVGRQQAFAVMASKCTLAQAECLRQMRDSRAYAAYGLTWDQFCRQHAGIARSQADRLIHQLNEFGAAYFRLSELVRISDTTYRKLAPRIQGETIELGGQQIAIIPENASKLRAGIHKLRHELRNLQTEMLFHRAEMAELQKRLEEVLGEFSRRARYPLPSDQRESLANILRHIIFRMNLVAAEFNVPPT
jgi:hypothetical protein